MVLIEDHDIVRFGLRRLLEESGTAAVVADSGLVGTALRSIATLEPDLVICDLSLPDSRGLETVGAVVAAQAGRPVFVLSMHDELLYAEQAIEAGARGYAMKDQAHHLIVAAVRAVLGGERWVSDRVRSQMLARIARRAASVPAERTGTALRARLTEREGQVLRLMARGRTTKQIAFELSLSARTVDALRAKLKAKLELRSGAELIAYAAANF